MSFIKTVLLLFVALNFSEYWIPTDFKKKEGQTFSESFFQTVIKPSLISLLQPGQIDVLD